MDILELKKSVHFCFLHSLTYLLDSNMELMSKMYDYADEDSNLLVSHRVMIYFDILDEWRGNIWEY